jgi:hypothetical protein
MLHLRYRISMGYITGRSLAYKRLSVPNYVQSDCGAVTLERGVLLERALGGSHAGGVAELVT